MHFEILVEDLSGKIALEAIVPKILGPNHPHSFSIHPYKGVGRVPKDLRATTEPRKRILLDQLPRILRGYGKGLLPRDDNAVIVIVDSDRKKCGDFKAELLSVLNQCHPAPRVLFRIAIEEMEAWLLGDRDAVLAAYPGAKHQPLDGYVQDSICGTWEVLADAVFSGGHAALKKDGYPRIGQAKCKWAADIAPRLNIQNNLSHSLKVFREAFSKLGGGCDTL